ncbi:hypothetical protein JCM33374_g3231 [Metschnikowia sp. JCM 33374]|nr:hypothetical protein JCM33374_g3231 [Metschnikowia sp. JCM 33374]
MKLVAVFFVLLHLAAGLVVVDSPIASACSYYLKNFNWGCGGSGQGRKLYKCRCMNIDWLGSMAYCMQTQSSTNHQIEHAWKHLSIRCVQKGDILYPVSEIKQFAENATRFVEPAPSNKTVRLYHPISVNASAFKIYKTSFDDINHYVFNCQWFGWGLVIFWGAYIAYLTVSNILWSFFRVSLFPKMARQWYQKHMTKETIPFGLSRADVAVMALFAIQTIMSTAFAYTVSVPNMFINDPYFLTLYMIGYRCGMLAFSLMPVVFVFGLRNNPFCTLTGLPQSTFITYHKFVAIVLSLEALLHSGIWTAYAIADGGYTGYSGDNYWRWGIVGTVLLFVMLGHSVGFIRNIMYELFLVLHKAFGWLFIVAMWNHCSILGWMSWVYSLIALTVYDRAVRLFKIFFINGGFTRIELEIVDDKIVKLTVPKSRLHDKFYRPGSHIFISFYHWPIWYQCFQSHPFTIVNSPVESEKAFTIYVRIKKGTTGALGKLRGDEKGNLSMWSLIEGPYGNGVPKFTQNEQLVGVAGGMGICALLPILYNNPDGALLFWAVNNTADIDYLSKDIEYLISKGTDVRVCLTRGKAGDDTSITSRCEYVTVFGSRPHVDEWVAEGLQVGIGRNKTDTYVLSCGPGRMDKDVQTSVSERTVIGSQHILHYMRENFQW